ncbi:MAG: stage II sporulation protein P [Enterocloster asparagiformis]|nr:stage II sporulation protein P [Enterocloster asparagiformis]
MKRRGLAGGVRWFAAGTGLILVLLLTGRAAGTMAGSLDQEACLRAVEDGGRWLVEYVWHQARPWSGSAAGRAGESGGVGDPDPAYRQYEAVKTFYEEHQYLAWYGNEETGETKGQSGQGQEAQSTEGGSGQGFDGQESLAQGETGGAGTAAPAGAALVGVTSRVVTGPTYVMEQLADYDFLVKHFYSIHTSTTAGRDELNAGRLLEEDLSLDGDNSKPQILIYHTHSQEAFADSGPGQTVVGIGNYLTELLTAKGYNVIHDTSVYDLVDGKLDRSKAYTYAYDGIARILEENPSVQVVLDIHRDGVGENLHLVTEVDGKPTAQIMFFNGMSQTPEGPIEYLQNPYREQNLAFSFQMQLDAQAYYPGFTRKIYLKGLRYNLHLRPRSALIEVGAQTNTYEEARNAMEPLSELLDMVLQCGRKNDTIQ